MPGDVSTSIVCTNASLTSISFVEVSILLMVSARLSLYRWHATKCHRMSTNDLRCLDIIIICLSLCRHISGGATCRREGTTGSRQILRNIFRCPWISSASQKNKQTNPLYIIILRFLFKYSKLHDQTSNITCIIHHSPKQISVVLFDNHSFSDSYSFLLSIMLT